MGWLTGKQVEFEVKNKRITIEPFNKDQLNPNSYDYRLSPLIRRLLPNREIHGLPCIDPKLESRYEEINITNEGFLMIPGQAYLASTQEIFGSNYFASLCTGKSSIGRLFLKNHQCAGLIDQGFLGHITLEITVTVPTLIYPNMRIGQMFWFESIGPVDLYHGKYQLKNMNKSEPSKIYLDLDK